VVVVAELNNTSTRLASVFDAIVVLTPDVEEGKKIRLSGLARWG
jgi:ADP-dependent phosphofructokinase/glucokinase